MADDKDTVEEGATTGGQQTGEESQGSTIANVHRNPNDKNYQLDIAGEEEVTTQGKEDVEDMRKMKKMTRRMMKRKIKSWR